MNTKFKSFIAICTLIMYVQISKAQVKVITGGNVSIGTTSDPDAVLNVLEADESTTQTNFTQAVSRAGILITTDYTANAYTPGLFWNTDNDNSTKPKAGIYLKETATGTNMYFGTSNAYSTGITNDAMVISSAGSVGIGTTDPDIWSFGTGYDYLTLNAIGTSQGAVLAMAADGTAGASINMGNATIRRASITANNGSNLGFWTNSTNAGTGVTERLTILSSGDVGIGTTTPSSRMEVFDTGTLGANTDVMDITAQTSTAATVNTLVGFNFNLQQSTNSPITFAAIRAGENNGTGSLKGALRFYTQDWSGGSNLVEQMRITQSGNVGIATTTSSYKLHVNGTFAANLGTCTSGSPNVHINTTTKAITYCTSTIRHKENVREFIPDVNKILNLELKRYNYKAAHGGENDIGLIAEEVVELIPELVFYAPKRTYVGSDGDCLRDSIGNCIEDKNEQQIEGVLYNRLPVYLLALAQAQQDSINELSDELENKNNELEEVNRRLDDLEALVQNCCSSGQIPAEKKETGYERDPGSFNLAGMPSFILKQNDPNPFSESTSIKFELPENSKGNKIIIYDNTGRIVNTLELDGLGDKGEVRIYGSDLSTGIYSYSLINNDRIVQSKQMIITK